MSFTKEGLRFSSYRDYYFHVCGMCEHWAPVKNEETGHYSGIDGTCTNSDSLHYEEILGFDCMIGRRCIKHEPTLEACLLRSV